MNDIAGRIQPGAERQAVLRRANGNVRQGPEVAEPLPGGTLKPGQKYETRVPRTGTVVVSIAGRNSNIYETQGDGTQILETKHLFVERFPDGRMIVQPHCPGTLRIAPAGAPEISRRVAINQQSVGFEQGEAYLYAELGNPTNGVWELSTGVSFNRNYSFTFRENEGWCARTGDEEWVPMERFQPATGGGYERACAIRFSLQCYNLRGQRFETTPDLTFRQERGDQYMWSLSPPFRPYGTGKRGGYTFPHEPTVHVALLNGYWHVQKGTDGWMIAHRFMDVLDRIFTQGTGFHIDFRLKPMVESLSAINANRGAVSVARPPEGSPRLQPFQADELVYLRRQHQLTVATIVRDRGGSTVRVRIGGSSIAKEEDVPRGQVWHIHEVEGPSRIPIQDMGHLLQSKENFLSRYRTLEDGRITTLFAGEPVQTEIGNCYMVSAMRSFKRSAHFRDFVATGIKEVRGANPGWEVRIPLASARTGSRWVFIRANQLEQQTGDGPPVHIEDGAIGWRILEAAFAFHGPRAAANAGRERKATEEGSSGEVYEFFFGRQGIRGLSPDIGSLDDGDPRRRWTREQVRGELEEQLRTFDSNLHIGTASSERGTRRYNVALVGGGTFTILSYHIYTIEGVNAAARTITLSDPHHKGRPFTMTWNTYFTSFRTTNIYTLNIRESFT